MKDVLSAINDRIKTPYYGYALLAFFTLNWKPLFLLAFSDGKAEERIVVFDSQTSLYSLLIFPLLIGLFISLANPWIRLLFARIEKTPRKRYSCIISDEEHDKLVYQNKLKDQLNTAEELEEARLINRAINDNKINEIDNSDVKRKVKSEIEAKRRSNDSSKRTRLTRNNVTPHESHLLKELWIHEAGMVFDTGNDIKIKHSSLILDDSNHEKEYEFYKEAISSLVSEGIFKKESNPDGHLCYKLTTKGWDTVESFF